MESQAIKELSLALAEREERIVNLERRVKELEACVALPASINEERKERAQALEEMRRW